MDDMVEAQRRQSSISPIFRHGIAPSAGARAAPARYAACAFLALQFVAHVALRSAEAHLSARCTVLLPEARD
eukprot:6190211-Pleurochrysis_carterae.AAC.2